jgi:hypothetical protein
MVVMSSNGEIVIAHHGKKELFVKLCRDGINAYSELGCLTIKICISDQGVKAMKEIFAEFYKKLHC